MQGWQEDVQKQIEAILSGPPGRAAFDFDNTMIFNDLGEACMYYILLQGLVFADEPSFWKEIRHPLISENELSVLREKFENAAESSGEEDQLDLTDYLLSFYDRIMEQDGLEHAYRWTRVIFAGRSPLEMRKISRYVFAHEQEQDIAHARFPSGRMINTGIRIYEPIRNLIQQMAERGWAIRIVSASPEEIIREAIAHWNLPEENVRGMRLRRDREILLPIIDEPMTYGPGKVQALKDTGWEDLDFAAGDSWTDFDMLLFAKKALLLDRNNPSLIQKGRESGFIIQKAFIQPHL